MKKTFYIVVASITLVVLYVYFLDVKAQNASGFLAKTKIVPQQNRAPLVEKSYLELPLGSIKAKGWLREQLIRQKNGATGSLDKLYPSVMGPRNGWLGGDGDQWERGPYWIDGLLPLAYLLDNDSLKVKANEWVEWAIQSQRDDGYFGPDKDYKFERGLQRNNSEDWWPKMVMLKVLMQHYSATGDKRVVKLMSNYFQYQLENLPETPLNNWTFWAKYRGGDNLMAVYWLYNITGEKWLLELGEIIYDQTYDFAHAFTERDMLTKKGVMHCVNLAQGIKTPIVHYQSLKDKTLLEATELGFSDIKRFNGQPHGLYGGDETVHGNNPTQGSELCTAAEMMFSLETMLPITGEVAYADKLEKIAFNALPTQIADDFMTRQYFQQTNQIMVTRHLRNFDVNHSGTDLCYGLLTGYPCCTSNMHQAWPKFTQNLWYATPDNGLAALVYGPSEVSATVGNGKLVTIEEKTGYPFKDKIFFTVRMKKGPVNFPLHLRVPGWCESASLEINGKQVETAEGGEILVVDRSWSDGDEATLNLPMNIAISRWYENSASVERGPLVYGLKMDETWTKVKEENSSDSEFFYEVTSETPWNYGLRSINANDFTVSISEEDLPDYPWNIDNAPVEITAKASRIPSWKLYNESAGPIPYSVMHGLKYNESIEEITLIPYGCTTLRIAEFPVIGKHVAY